MCAYFSSEWLFECSSTRSSHFCASIFVSAVDELLRADIRFLYHTDAHRARFALPDIIFSLL